MKTLLQAFKEYNIIKNQIEKITFQKHLQYYVCSLPYETNLRISMWDKKDAMNSICTAEFEVQNDELKILSNGTYSNEEVTKMLELLQKLLETPVGEKP